MNFQKILFLAFLGILALSSCKDDEPEPAQPLSEGVDITLRNTLQDPNENEVTYPSLFGQADDAYDEFATLSNSTTEFATA